jgi:hypothetical protein
MGDCDFTRGFMCAVTQLVRFDGGSSNAAFELLNGMGKMDKSHIDPEDLHYLLEKGVLFEVDKEAVTVKRS